MKHKKIRKISLDLVKQSHDNLNIRYHSCPICGLYDSIYCLLLQVAKND